MAKSLKEIEYAFEKSLSQLKSLNYDILDVKVTNFQVMLSHLGDSVA